MDEFDKIRELSNELTDRREPSFTFQDKVTEVKIGDDTERSEVASLSVFNADEPKDPAGEEVVEKEPSTVRLHMIALISFAFVLVAVVIGFAFFGDSTAPEEVVTITATAEPVKVKPDQPGGLLIPDQDKVVYEKMRSGSVPTKVEKLFPEAEQPVVPDGLKEAPADDLVPVEQIKAINPLQEAAPAAPIKVEAVPLDAPKPKPAVQKAAAPAAPAEVWKVQLLSSSSKASVEKAWPRILAKNKALLSNMPYSVVSANVPGKGIFYRLWVGQFKSKEMASSLCNKLKARKQDCVVAK
ncbi:MAG: SPOR domain-containing protein [Alphaproteobacteria bacterium]|nr:SPOR domain-containing protein [Alphaproteobacteria bacterium]